MDPLLLLGYQDEVVSLLVVEDEFHIFRETSKGLLIRIYDMYFFVVSGCGGIGKLPLRCK